VPGEKGDEFTVLLSQGKKIKRHPGEVTIPAYDYTPEGKKLISGKYQ